MIRMRVRGVKQVVARLNRVEKGLNKMGIKDLGEAIRGKVKEGIRTKTGVHGPYHTYKSTQHPVGELERSVKISYPGRGKIIASVYAPHAAVVEEGRRAVHNVVFRGYYPNRFKGFTPWHTAYSRPYGKFTVYALTAQATKGKHYMLKTYLWLRERVKSYFETKVKNVVEKEGIDRNISVLITKR